MKFSLRLYLFLLLLAGVTTIGTKRRSTRGFELSSEDLELYTRNHDSIEDYDFTTPVYIEPESLVSKRSVDSEPVTSQEREVKFTAFGQLYHARLQPNNWLVRQGLVAEFVGADGSVTKEEITSWDCHYFAHLISHVGESAGALSTCDGLRGLISHDNTDIYIAPLKDHHALRYRREVQDELHGDEHAHIVYKRTASRRGQPTSDTMSSASSSFDYDHGYDGHNSHDSDDDVDGELTYDETSESDYWNDTYDNNTFCKTVYAPEYTEGPDPPSEDSYSRDQGSEEWGNTSHPRPIFVDVMAAGQEDGEHKQEGGQRYIELFLLVDDSMKNFHQEDLMNYSLTLMNIVSRRYTDRTMKSEVRLALTKIMIAETHELTMTAPNGRDYKMLFQPHGSRLLNNFCYWQKYFNPPSDEDPLHYDGAILLTRRDLYAVDWNRIFKGLLGVARLGTICRMEDACSVNEDRGLESALIVTHELGHNLNLKHDPDFGCADGKNIMSSQQVVGQSGYHWSSCSAENFAKFLESRRSACIKDEPSTDHPKVQMLRLDQLAGVRYSRLEQCQLAFGKSITELCPSNRLYTTCGKIGCRRSDKCVYTSVMEGTTCGQDMWCYEGHCHTSIGGIPDPIHGGWSEWVGNYTHCSRTCGAGVRHIRRFCNNPTPRFGGLACEGPMYVMRTCNENPCPGINSSDDYRNRECALTNSIKYRYKYHEWKADLWGSFYGNQLCVLRCESNLGPKANRPPNRISSGTQCWDKEEPDELRRIRRCVDGECKELGCDGVYWSGKLLDRCHKCDGTGRTCTTVKGAYREREPVPIGSYWHWLTIPIGSTGVNITNNDGRNLAMALKFDGKFIFKPDAKARTNARRFTEGKTHILLRAVRFDWEQIWVLSGPTTKTIEIHVLNERSVRRTYMDVYRKPYLHYEWNEPISDPVSYYWATYPLTDCSATCGGGNKTVIVTCIEEINGERVNASDRFCNEIKPSIYEECNTESCGGPEWRIGEWGSCSVTCNEGMEARMVDCIDGLTMDILPNNDCIVKEGYQPDNTRPCYKPPCQTHAPTPPRPTEIETTVSPTTKHSTDHMTTPVDVTVDLTSIPPTTKHSTDHMTTPVDVTMDLTSSTTTPPTTKHSTVNMTTPVDATMNLTSSRSSLTRPPPIISVPKSHACEQKSNNLYLLFCLIIGIFMACNKLNM